MGIPRFAAVVLGASAALFLGACSHRASQKSAFSIPIPIMPLAQGHLPPLAGAAPPGQVQSQIPMRVAQVRRRGRVVHVAWDAPGATQAVISFSADGTVFQTVDRTGDPAADFTASAMHGIIRIFVTDGKRRNTVDYRI